MLLINQYLKKGEKLKSKSNVSIDEFNISSDEEEDVSLNNSTVSSNT